MGKRFLADTDASPVGTLLGITQVQVTMCANAQIRRDKLVTIQEIGFRLCSTAHQPTAWQSALFNASRFAIRALRRSDAGRRGDFSVPDTWP
jgi:hypothetical protein